MHEYVHFTGKNNYYGQTTVYKSLPAAAATAAASEAAAPLYKSPIQIPYTNPDRRALPAPCGAGVRGCAARVGLRCAETRAGGLSAAEGGRWGRKLAVPGRAHVSLPTRLGQPHGESRCQTGGVPGKSLPDRAVGRWRVGTRVCGWRSTASSSPVALSCTMPAVRRAR